MSLEEGDAGMSSHGEQRELRVWKKMFSDDPGGGMPSVERLREVFSDLECVGAILQRIDLYRVSKIAKS